MPEHTKEKDKVETQTVMMGRDLASKVRTIADHLDITMVEVLERFARPGLVKEYKRVLHEKQSEFGDPGA